MGRESDTFQENNIATGKKRAHFEDVFINKLGSVPPLFLLVMLVYSFTGKGFAPNEEPLYPPWKWLSFASKKTPAVFKGHLILETKPNQGFDVGVCIAGLLH